MKNDTLIRIEGMKALSSQLDIVEVERFITLLLREPFDYTEWQKNLYNDKTVDEIGQDAMQYWNKTHVIRK
ncbi:MAG: hypothetical protein LBC74_08520 [Planctomycetaceae bacterium]|jgi:hypothetical protein|nr:hypothetical protein [Planctomycetaceae bacterium]